MGTKNEVSTNGSEQTLRSEEELQTYVVQVRELVLRAGDVEEDGTFDQSKAGVAWVDVAEVKVPPRTKHVTVVDRGLAQAGIEKTLELQARCLDEKAHYVWQARPPAPAALRLA